MRESIMEEIRRQVVGLLTYGFEPRYILLGANRLNLLSHELRESGGLAGLYTLPIPEEFEGLPVVVNPADSNQLLVTGGAADMWLNGHIIRERVWEAKSGK